MNITAILATVSRVLNRVNAMMLSGGQSRTHCRTNVWLASRLAARAHPAKPVCLSRPLTGINLYCLADREQWLHDPTNDELRRNAVMKLCRNCFDNDSNTEHANLDELPHQTLIAVPKLLADRFI